MGKWQACQGHDADPEAGYDGVKSNLPGAEEAWDIAEAKHLSLPLELTLFTSSLWLLCKGMVQILGWQACILQGHRPDDCFLCITT